MKTSDLKSNTTYVGKNGKRRHICNIRLGWPQNMVMYDVPEGGMFSCRDGTFARWAEREATPEEAAPKTD